MQTCWVVVQTQLGYCFLRYDDTHQYQDDCLENIKNCHQIFYTKFDNKWLRNCLSKSVEPFCVQTRVRELMCQQPYHALHAVSLQYYINAKRLKYKGQQSIIAMQERNFPTPEMYSAASIGELKQGK